jgi:hypothetical protein
MQSRTEGFGAEIEAEEISKSQPKSFELYEEYSRKNIVETIRSREEAYEKANRQAKEELETEVEIEVENFHIWLEAERKLKPFAAHYYAVSLKSLLLGHPTGIQIAQLFDIALERLHLLT